MGAFLLAATFSGFSMQEAEALQNPNADYNTPDKNPENIDQEWLDDYAFRHTMAEKMNEVNGWDTSYPPEN